MSAVESWGRRLPLFEVAATRRKARAYWREVSADEPDFTCDDCPAVLDCPSAFDLYNTNGDCLELK